MNISTKLVSQVSKFITFCVTKYQYFLPIKKNSNNNSKRHINSIFCNRWAACQIRLKFDDRCWDISYSYQSVGISKRADHLEVCYITNWANQSVTVQRCPLHTAPVNTVVNCSSSMKGEECIVTAKPDETWRNRPPIVNINLDHISRAWQSGLHVVTLAMGTLAEGITDARLRHWRKTRHSLDSLPLRIFCQNFNTRCPVPRQLEGAKILLKSSTLWVKLNNVTDRWQTDHFGSCHWQYFCIPKCEGNVVTFV